MKEILKVRNLNKKFDKNTIALNNINIDVYEGESLGIVGESGSGKTTLGRIILMLISADSGEILYNEKNILNLNEKEKRELRKDIQMILQDPYSSLNPLKTIGWHLEEPLKVLEKLSKNERKKKVLEMMELVGLNSEYYEKYPRELSGGQKQRVVILASLMVKPKIIVADEAVSALDLSVQAQILNLLRELQVKMKLTYIFISHDLNVVRYICDRVAIMKDGELIEVGETEDIFENPKEKYTQELIEAAKLELM
jgi:ABC-type oligopeptide transport system ATPase subunit